jgi:hypothetical protein
MSRLGVNPSQEVKWASVFQWLKSVPNSATAARSTTHRTGQAVTKSGGFPCPADRRCRLRETAASNRSSRWTAARFITSINHRSDGVISIGEARLKNVPVDGGDERIVLQVVRCQS